MLRRTGIRAAAAVGGVGLALAGFALPAAAQAGDPPGNNGTVKIDGTDFDDHPNNEPHVGCVFQVDFYGFDEGDLDASVTFTPIAPTPGDDLVVDDLDIGEDAAGGGTDLDASATYDLSAGLAGIEPHPQQGWHIKLTVHADGSQGADTKFKAFWVESCDEEPPTTTSSTTAPGSTTTTTEKGHHGSTTTTTDGDGGSSTTTTAPPSDGGSGAPGGPQPGAPGGGAGGPASGADALAQTGSNSSVPLTIGALALVAIGATAALWARKVRPD